MDCTFPRLPSKGAPPRFPNCGSTPREILALGGRGTDLDIIGPLSTPIGELGRFIVGEAFRPTVAPGAALNPPRPAFDARLIVGRAKLRAGGVIRA